MARFETIVRPVVFPDIRPASPRVLPPAEDDGEGVVLHSNPSKSMSLSYSYSFSASSSRADEMERVVDEVRVYQKNKDGSINRNNFVDIEVAKKLRMQGASISAVDSTGGPGAGTPGTGSSMTFKERLQWLERYRPASEDEKNIEIRKRDQTKKNDNPAT